MEPLNLRAFDLNLLPILDALLDEQSVSLAAERVNLSQSATSSALLRLRETFNDPIVIRQGQRMVPSRRALLIRDQLKTGLTTITDLIGELRNNAAEPPRRLVCLSAPEHVQLILADAINGLLADASVPLDLRIRTLEHQDMAVQLDQRRVDIAMGSFGSLPDKFHRRKLYKETVVAVLRRDHPALSGVSHGRLAMADLGRYPHLVVTNGEDPDRTALAQWLASRSVRRRVAVVVEHISMVTDILRSSDCICLGTERSFSVTPDHDRHLTALAMPCEMADDHYLIEMVWHDRSEPDDALRHVRRALHDFCRRL